MKAFLIITILFFLGAGCAESQENNNDILGITVLYRSPTCDGFCRIQLTANSNKKVIIETPGIEMDRDNSDRTLKRNWVELTSGDWERLLDSFSLEEIMALPEISGCPGCDDEHAAANLILVTDNVTYRRVFEGHKPPTALKGLIGELAGRLLQMERIQR